MLSIRMLLLMLMLMSTVQGQPSLASRPSRAGRAKVQPAAPVVTARAGHPAPMEAGLPRARSTTSASSRSKGNLLETADHAALRRWWPPQPRSSKVHRILSQLSTTGTCPRPEPDIALERACPPPSPYRLNFSASRKRTSARTCQEACP